MLKRPRPLTPPPSSLSLSEFEANSRPMRPLPSRSLTDGHKSRAKRQRTVAPSQGSSVRGYFPLPDLIAFPSHNLGGPESDGEEDWVENESEREATYTPGASAAYKQANSFLHEVHTLNQHRLLFSSKSYPTDNTFHPSINGSSSLGSPSSIAERSHSSPIPLTTPSHQLGKLSLLHLSQDPSHVISTQSTPSLQSNQAPSPQSPEVDTQEVQSVFSHYGDINKLLRSLVLLRRRELFDDSDRNSHSLDPSHTNSRSGSRHS